MKREYIDPYTESQKYQKKGTQAQNIAQIKVPKHTQVLKKFLKMYLK